MPRIRQLNFTALVAPGLRHAAELHREQVVGARSPLRRVVWTA